MTRPIQHHFVPRSYLEGFADAGGQLHIYERGKEQPFVLAPEKAARQRNYYSVRRKDGTFDDTIEHFLDKSVEAPAVAVICKLVNGYQQPTWEDRIALARWIAFQEHRTPLQRGGFEQMAQKLLKQTMQMMAASPGYLEHVLAELAEQGEQFGVTADDLRKSIEQDGFEIEVNPIFSLDTMLISEEFVPIIASMRWTLMSGADAVTFVTSDHPVIRHDPGKESPFRYGYASPTIEFGLPLNASKFLLVTRDLEREQKFAELVKAGKDREAEDLKLSLPTLGLKELDSEKTWKLKEATIRSAPRFIFCPDEDPKYAELLKQEPWILRMQVG
jgi:Protein of unknown function (DUF4238)